MDHQRNFRNHHPQVRIHAYDYKRLRAAANKDGIPIARKLAEYIEWGLEVDGANSNRRSRKDRTIHI